jgi:S1/P1 Nuclease
MRQSHCLGMISLWLLTALFSSPSFAWNQLGHRVIAAIAYEHLTPAAKKQVTEWLSHHPDYNRWTQTAQSEDVMEAVFLAAATWPDEIKSAPGYQNDGEIPRDAASGQNIGFADMRMHKYWHYVDFGFSRDGTPTVAPPAVNAVTQITLFHQALSDPHASPALKAYDLAWLIHVVGDIHQPMHAVSRFTQDATEGDAGGNRVKLCASPCRNNLHSLWDDALGHGKDAEAAIRTASRLERHSAESLGPIDPKAWGLESFKLAQEVAYQAPSIGERTHELAVPTEAYRQQVHAVAKDRATLAGLRLAMMINAEVAASQH